jgi:hypothetical protein
MPLILDLTALGILAYNVWQGFRKGLILTAAGLVITLVSLWAAWGCASIFADALGTRLEESLAPVIEEAVSGAANAADITPALENLGFSGMANNALAEAVMRKAGEAGTSIKDAAVSSVCRSAAFMLLLIAGFIVIKTALGFAARLVSGLFKLPVLNLFNKTGGAILGLVCGIAVLLVLGWGLKFMGTWIPAETVAQTSVAKHFTGSGALDRLTAALAGKL